MAAESWYQKHGDGVYHHYIQYNTEYSAPTGCTTIREARGIPKGMPLQEFNRLLEEHRQKEEDRRQREFDRTAMNKAGLVGANLVGDYLTEADIAKADLYDEDTYEGVA